MQRSRGTMHGSDAGEGEKAGGGEQQWRGRVRRREEALYVSSAGCQVLGEPRLLEGIYVRYKEA